LPIALVEAQQQVQGERDGGQRPGTSSHHRSKEALRVNAATLGQDRRVAPGERGKLNDTQTGQQAREELVQPTSVVGRPASNEKMKAAKIASSETSPQAPNEPLWLQRTLIYAVEDQREASRDGLFRFYSLVPTILTRKPRKPLEGSHDEVVERRLIHLDKVDPRQSVLVGFRVLPSGQVRNQALEAGALAHPWLPKNHQGPARCGSGDGFKSVGRTKRLTAQEAEQSLRRLAQEPVGGHRQRVAPRNAPAFDDPAKPRTHPLSIPTCD
jgi:hypothetical protein